MREPAGSSSVRALLGEGRSLRLITAAVVAARVALIALPQLAGAVLSGTNGRILFTSGRDVTDAQAELRFARDPAGGLRHLHPGPRGARARGRGRAPTSANRANRRCLRFVRVGELSQAATAGARSTFFAGRLRGRALSLGGYRALLSATDAAGNRSAAVAIAFRVVG